MLLLALRETYALNRLSSFKNLRRKGGKCDHRPGRPKVLLRHWPTAQDCIVADYYTTSLWSQLTACQAHPTSSAVPKEEVEEEEELTIC